MNTPDIVNEFCKNMGKKVEEVLMQKICEGYDPHELEIVYYPTVVKGNEIIGNFTVRVRRRNETDC